MANNVPTAYRKLIEAQRLAAEGCFDDGEALAAFSNCHNFLSDLSALRSTLSGRVEARCFDAAVQEYQYALSALITGQYRHAFGGLRLSFELCLATIYFSAHEVKLRQWLAGDRDITWAGLIDEDKGLFSQSFVGAFNLPLVELRRRFLSLAKAVYRECSEYVHGNPRTHEQLAGELVFKNDMLFLWREKLESIRLCVLYCSVYRYADQWSVQDRDNMEPIVMDAFGHEQEIRALFQEPQ